MSAQAPEELFGPAKPATGDVATDLLSVDWAATPLGPPQTWPRSLTTVVRMLIDSRFSMWMAWGPDLTFFCNEAYRRDTLRAKYPWALGRPAREVWAEIWGDIGPRIDKVLGTGEATWDEALLLFLERSGYTEETYHTFSYSPLTGDDGDIAGMLCVVTEDTERVIAERRMTTLRELGAEMARASTEVDLLAAAQRQLAAAPHSVPFSLIYLLDADEPVARLVVTAGAQDGDPIAPALLALDDPDSPWPVADVLSGQTVTVSRLPDRFPVLPTGAWDEPPLQALAVPLLQPGQDRPYGFLLVGLNRYRPLDGGYRGFVDLLAGQIAAGLTRARAYDAERERAAQLAELDQAKTTFFTNISHELRTPLTLLLGPAEDALADEQAPLPTPQRSRVEVIERNAERLLKLVNTLLDFSRLESGRMAARYEPLDLARYTGELASMFDSAVRRAGLTLTIDCAPVGEPAFVDREMWAKIVLNLISNALKATFDGGIAVTLRRDGEDGTDVVLAVTDSGIGISPADQQHLFERFHRVAGAALRTHEGSGIGLALVAELAALHGGSVSVESTPGDGSTFAVRIPLGSAHLPAEQVVTQPQADGPGAADFSAAYLAEAARWVEDEDGDLLAEHLAGAPRILVADDTPDMREYIAGLLADTYQVQTAVDGREALERALDNPPDLILTDVMMPRLDGFGLLAALRESPVTMHIPVIMVSARAGDESTVEGLEAGADDYLVKPFSARELTARVRANLELDRVRRVAHELQRSRELLDQAEQLAHVGSWEIDLSTNHLRGSVEYFALLGATPEEIAAGGLESAFEHVHPDDVPAVQAAIADCVAGGPDLDLELRVVGPGDERIVRAFGVLRRDGNGRPQTVRGSAQDITAQRQAERELAAAAAEREAAAREHQIAEELQRSLLPAVSVTTDFLDVAAYYRAGVAGTQVGGDWYDAVPVAEDCIALMVGDVMGRGVRAASVMGQLRAAARAYSRLGLSPSRLLGLLDAAVEDVRGDMIVTCAYAVFDPVAGVLRYASAGHLPILVIGPDGSIRQLPAGGPPLGTGGAGWQELTESVPAGSYLALYTDGLVEQRGSDLELGIDALAALLRRDTLRAVPVADMPAAVADALVADGPDDDVALLIARVTRTCGTDEMTVAVPAERGAVARARRAADETLAAWDLSALSDDVQLVVSELVTNGLTHGNGPVVLRARRTPSVLQLEVDDGSATLPSPVDADIEDDHGRGLQIVSVLADRWGTRATASGKTVWCEFERPAPS